jgi:hypothetical protein
MPLGLGAQWWDDRPFRKPDRQGNDCQGNGAHSFDNHSLDTALAHVSWERPKLELLASQEQFRDLIFTLLRLLTAAATIPFRTAQTCGRGSGFLGCSFPARAPQ